MIYFISMRKKSSLQESIGFQCLLDFTPTHFQLSQTSHIFKILNKFIYNKIMWFPLFIFKQVYEKLSHVSSPSVDMNGSPMSPSPIISPSEIIVDPRLFEERFDQVSPTEPLGGSVTNIHPDDMFNLPAVYAAVCNGVVRNLVSMAPPEVIYDFITFQIVKSQTLLK